MIREARPEDLASVQALLRQLGYDLDARATFERLLADRAHVLLIAEVDGRVAGYANLNVRAQLHHERPVGTLDELCVDEASRGRGIGALLLDAVLTAARERNAEAVELTTNVRRARALAFYERHGFERTSHKLVCRLD